MMQSQEVTVLYERKTPFGTEPTCWVCGKHVRTRYYWVHWLEGRPAQVCDACQEDGYPWYGTVELRCC